MKLGHRSQHYTVIFASGDDGVAANSGMDTKTEVHKTSNMPLEFGCSYIAAIRETMSCANDIIDDPESKM
ncbi:hypothetical protein ACHAPF_005991 [Botrytis cinerea]